MNEYSFKVLHSVSVHGFQVLIAEINVSLCKDVPTAIVISVPSQLISELFRLGQDLSAIKKTDRQRLLYYLTYLTFSFTFNHHCYHSLI